MLRGIYASASGMLADQTRLDVVANNLANVSTTGYKRETTISQPFRELFIRRVNDREANQTQQGAEFIGRMGLGTFVVNTATRLTNGTQIATGNPLDVAISGDGFFAVQTPQGVRYTRQGSFRLGSDGTLVTPEGLPVLVNGRPATAVNGDLSISDNGDVRSGSQVLGRLTMATSQQLGAMRKEGAGLWAVAGGADASVLIPAAESSGQFQLRVGYLESSNVEAVSEMVEMITIMRSYEANQKSLQAQDETLQKAVTEVGRLS